MGAPITFNLKDAITTKRAERQRRDRAAFGRGETPAVSDSRATPRRGGGRGAGDRSFRIADSTGKVVRRMDAPAARGLQRVNWDLRAQGTQLAPAIAPAAPAAVDAAARAVAADVAARGGGRRAAVAAVAMTSSLASSADAAAAADRSCVPGKYTVSLAKRVEGVITPLAGSQTVEVVAEGPATQEDRVAMAEFQEKLSASSRRR